MPQANPYLAHIVKQCRSQQLFISASKIYQLMIDIETMALPHPVHLTEQGLLSRRKKGSHFPPLPIAHRVIGCLAELPKPT